MKKSALIIFGLIVLQSTAFAWPNMEKTYELLGKLKDVKCTMSLKYLLETEEGYSTPDEDADQYQTVVLMDNIPLEASSSSRFATYSLNWENDDYKFMAYQNSQTGAISIYDKKTNIQTQTSMDIYDLDKDWPYLASSELKYKENLMVTSPFDPELKVPGEKTTYLKATCHTLKSYMP